MRIPSIRLLFSATTSRTLMILVGVAAVLLGDGDGNLPLPT